MKATFQNSVDVLVRAYLNDTLKHQDCERCAVGNLVAAAKDVPCGDETRDWYDAIAGDGTIDWQSYRGNARKQITLTGYTAKQIAKIEYAFESVDECESDDDWMFNGLMAVVDVLAEIHGVDLTTKENAIGQFKEVQLSKLGA